MTEPDSAFEDLLHYLRDSRGFDFTGYKRTSLMRRVDRRMQDADIPSYEAYLDLLQVRSDEFTALFNTILINVTDFFRDRESWDELRQTVLPPMVERRAGGPIRVWSAGCATGQEAYTLAIVFAEMLGLEAFRERVKIYATDVDEEALADARQATYSERDLSGMPPELREKYFESNGPRSTFSKDLRRAVIFGRNDLVQDAPISRIDLLACRNTLMYFNAETQAKVVNRFHFALAPDGVLFLGKAEMLLGHGDLFAPLDLKRRFFTRVPAENGERPAAHRPQDSDPEALAPVDELLETALAAGPLPQMVLSTDGRLAIANDAATRMFGLSARDLGRPFHDLELSYRPVDLRTAIDQAATERQDVWLREVEWSHGPGERGWFDVQVIPLGTVDRGIGIAVHFHDVTRHRRLHDELEQTHRHLETAYEELQSTNEELETTNEELQSTVEELETTNEELQSTNEELETMNEELQSMNDELQSMNEELRDRTTALNDVNGYFDSVLTSLQAGVVVVDPDLRVLTWNRQAEDLWGLRSDEVAGQHLLNLDIGLPADEIRPLVRAALANGVDPHHADVAARNRRGRDVMIRLTCTAMRGAADEPRGVVLVMSDLNRK
ncbi:MAG: two-component system, chemotaxis family, CheB/CheR fusion protein [Frankiales bacterium]|jgi:two-component system CheB/CheR fusion protein|nr:two-component system, chemotaxis family, CheB/CheR fusion protein [Frankiales bacterium]